MKTALKWIAAALFVAALIAVLLSQTGWLQ